MHRLGSSRFKRARSSGKKIERRATPVSPLLSAVQKEAETRFGSALRASSGIIDRKKQPPLPGDSRPRIIYSSHVRLICPIRMQRTLRVVNRMGTFNPANESKRRGKKKREVTRQDACFSAATEPSLANSRCITTFETRKFWKQLSPTINF